MAKFKFSVGTSYIGSVVIDNIEIPDDVLNKLSTEERFDFIDRKLEQWVWENINTGWTEL